MSNESTVTQALKDARHELETMHGLYAHDNPRPDMEGEDAWQINATKIVNKIEQALASEASERSLSERIEQAYNEVIEQRRIMQKSLREYRGWETATKLEHANEWAAAKNDNVRKVLLDGWLEEDLDYQQACGAYEDARDNYRLALLEVERLRLLVELEKTGR